MPRLCVGGEGCHFQEPLPGVFSLLFPSGPRMVNIVSNQAASSHGLSLSTLSAAGSCARGSLFAL